MKKSIFVLSLLITVLLMFSSCQNTENKDVEFNFTPENLQVFENETKEIVLVANIKNDGALQKIYIEDIEVLSVDNILDDMYKGEADIILSGESDGVSSLRFEVTGKKTGNFAFEIMAAIKYSDTKEEENHIIKLEGNVLAVNVNEAESSEFISEEISDSEVGLVANNVSKDGYQPAFPYLGIADYINVNPLKTHNMLINKNLQGHTISKITYGGAVSFSQKARDAKSNEEEIRVTARANEGAGFIKVYLYHPSYNYNSASALPIENAYGPYYSTENGMLVVTYDVNVKNETSQGVPIENTQPVEEMPKDYYNPMIKN